jgi:hypothetical protein
MANALATQQISRTNGIAQGQQWAATMAITAPYTTAHQPSVAIKHLRISQIQLGHELLLQALQTRLMTPWIQ